MLLSCVRVCVVWLAVDCTRYLLQWDNSAVFAGLTNPGLLANQQFYFSQNLGATTTYFYNVIGLPAVRWGSLGCIAAPHLAAPSLSCVAPHSHVTFFSCIAGSGHVLRPCRGLQRHGA